jgi:hypothetical protein
MNTIAYTWPLSYWTTVMFLTLLPAAVIARANPFLVAVVVVNYFGTAAIRQYGDIMTVGFLDAICAAFIIALINGDRPNIVAALFLLMPSVYAISWLLGASEYATFAVVEPLGWLQIAVIGNVDRGIGRVLGFMGASNPWKRSDRDHRGRFMGPISARGTEGALGCHETDGR